VRHSVRVIVILEEALQFTQGSRHSRKATSKQIQRLRPPESSSCTSASIVHSSRTSHCSHSNLAALRKSNGYAIVTSSTATWYIFFARNHNRSPIYLYPRHIDPRSTNSYVTDPTSLNRIAARESVTCEDDGMDFIEDLNQIAARESVTCGDDGMDFIEDLNQIAARESVTCEDDGNIRDVNQIAAQCSYDETTDHNRGACESGVETYDYLAQQAAQCSWDETLDHYRHYYTSPMVNRPCLFVSADDILEEREDSPILTNAYQYDLSQYNAHHGHAQISYRGRIYIPIGVERDYLQEQNQMYMQQQQIDNSSQGLFTQNSEETEQENWMEEFIQDRPEETEQNHLQYIQQQIEDDSSQNGEENWMEEFIQDRPFYV
ncbi:unnamed protein product, partial [Trichogramma brassicae]